MCMTTPFISDLDTPILQLSAKDVITLRDCYQGGIFVLGEPGSGKTSGVGKASAGALLRSGAGLCVAVCKNTDIDLWKQYAKEHGREHDIVLFDKNAGINFLQYEFARKGADGANAVIDTLMKILEFSNRAAGPEAAKKGEAFWEETAEQLLKYSVAPLYAATGTVRMSDLIKFIEDAPTKKPTTPEEQKSLEENNFTIKTLHKMYHKPVREIAQDMRAQSRQYWLDSYPTLPENTRGSIKITVTSKLTKFNTGMLRKCFCDKTTIVPEMSLAGKIIVLALPVLTMGAEAILAQQLFIYLWMSAVESRNGLPQQFRDRPVCLFVDECQFFINSHWDTFLSISRDSRCAVIAMTQSLPTLYAQLGKDNSDFVDGLTGKFSSKVFFLNSCPRSNKWAMELIGKGLKIRKTQSQNITQAMNTNRGGNAAMTNEGWNKNTSSNEGTSTQEYEAYLLEANYLATQLRTGGPKNNFETSGVWFKAGAQFLEPIPDTSSNIKLCTFTQK